MKKMVCIICLGVITSGVVLAGDDALLESKPSNVTKLPPLLVDPALIKNGPLPEASGGFIRNEKPINLKEMKIAPNITTGSGAISNVELDKATNYEQKSPNSQNTLSIINMK